MRYRAFVVSASLLAFALAAGSPLARASESDPSAPPGNLPSDLDTRVPREEVRRAGFRFRSPSAAQLQRAELLQHDLPGVTLRWDGMSGAPKWLAAPAGRALAALDASSPEDAVRSFLAVHATLYGIDGSAVDALELTDVVPAGGGGHHVHLRQRYRGLEVFGSHVNANLGRDGSVQSIGSSLYGDLNEPGTPLLTAAAAVRVAAADVYPHRVFIGRVASVEPGPEHRTEFNEPDFAAPLSARLVIFPEAAGSRLAWRVRIGDPRLVTRYLLLVDARDATVLYRRSTVFHAEARYVEGLAPDPDTEEFSPDNYVLRTIPASTSESPAGWIVGDGTQLRGNNVIAPLGFAGEPGLEEPTAVYDYAFGSGPSGVVNLWWYSNEAHDHFYRIGFDEPAGNMQEDNFGQGGLGGDPAQAVLWLTTPTGGAWALPEPDGEIGTLNMGYMSSAFAGDHDGYPENGGERNMGFLVDTIFHEYTHLVTSRVLGGPSVIDCWDGVQSMGLAEGWSEIFEYSYCDVPRSFFWGVDGFGFGLDARHDLDYADFCNVGDAGCYSHGEGMIWAGTLWDLRQSLIALEGPGGVEMFDRLTLEGAAGTTCSPTFLDARDALLAADTNLYGSAHHTAIWNVFAARGMGDGASTTGPDDPVPVADFSVPAAHSCAAPAPPTGPSAAADGDNAIRLDYSATGASAVEIWREDLDSPFDRPARIALTPDTATYVDTDVQGGRSYRYHLVALGDGGVVCRSGTSSPADATATGACDAYPIFDPRLTITEGGGSCDVVLSWAPASSGCPGSSEPIVYNVYRARVPGYRSQRTLLVGRTQETTFTDIPPEDGDVHSYLVLAQHGTLDDSPDHRRRDPVQLYRWVPRVPTGPRQTVHTWSFDSGPEGWATDNTNDPVGGWTLAQPHGTYWGGALLAPDEPAGGTGQSWVTGDAADADSVTSHDSDGVVYLTSPTWDGTGGATVLSFDYWMHVGLRRGGGLRIRIDNGAGQATVPVSPHMMVQSFDSAGRHGWQRAEIDLAAHIAPTATMSVTIINNPSNPLSEFGVDNVRVERATACARSGLTPVSVTVDDSPEGWGNGNGVLEPGETARLDVQVRNEGSLTAFSPVGKLHVGYPGFLVHEPESIFPDAAPGATVDSAGDGFTVTAPMGAGCRDSIVLEFELRDAAGTLTRHLWDMEYGDPLDEQAFEDDFETDKGWWIVDFIPGMGVWQRGDPVGTMNGPDPANPEDCADGPGTSCYVTENGLPGGPAGATDVDFYPVWLRSPPLNLRQYKRARLQFDLWYYDSSLADPGYDYGGHGYYVEDPASGVVSNRYTYVVESTGGWTSMDVPFTGPLTGNARVAFEAFDYTPNDIMEMGVDNVVVVGQRQVCDLPGITNPPIGVGDTVMVSKAASGVQVDWQPSPAGAGHDAAAYYEVYVSRDPDAGFVTEDTATTTTATFPIAGASEYFKVAAVNAAGTSGDEPAP